MYSWKFFGAFLSFFKIWGIFVISKVFWGIFVISPSFYNKISLELLDFAGASLLLVGPSSWPLFSDWWDFFSNLSNPALIFFDNYYYQQCQFPRFLIFYHCSLMRTHALHSFSISKFFITPSIVQAVGNPWVFLRRKEGFVVTSEHVEKTSL